MEKDFNRSSYMKEYYLKNKDKMKQNSYKSKCKLKEKYKEYKSTEQVILLKIVSEIKTKSEPINFKIPKKIKGKQIEEIFFKDGGYIYFTAKSISKNKYILFYKGRVSECKAKTKRVIFINKLFNKDILELHKNLSRCSQC